MQKHCSGVSSRREIRSLNGASFALNVFLNAPMKNDDLSIAFP